MEQKFLIYFANLSSFTRKKHFMGSVNAQHEHVDGIPINVKLWTIYFQRWSLPRIESDVNE